MKYRCLLLLLILIGLAMSGLSQTVSGNVSTSDTPFVQGSEGYTCYRVPALVVSNSGSILAFAEGRRDGCRDDGVNRCQNPVPIALGDGMYTCYTDIALIDKESIGVLYETGYKYADGICFKIVKFSDITSEL